MTSFLFDSYPRISKLFYKKINRDNKPVKVMKIFDSSPNLSTTESIESSHVAYIVLIFFLTLEPYD